jgi:hypothetical protein
MDLIDRFLSPDASRHRMEEAHPGHPRQRMPPMSELEMADAWCAASGCVEDHAVQHCDHGFTHPETEGVGTPVGKPGHDPVDQHLEPGYGGDMDLDVSFSELERLDLDEPLPDLY